MQNVLKRKPIKIFQQCHWTFYTVFFDDLEQVLFQRDASSKTSKLTFLKEFTVKSKFGRNDI